MGSTNRANRINNFLPWNAGSQLHHLSSLASSLLLTLQNVAQAADGPEGPDKRLGCALEEGQTKLRNRLLPEHGLSMAQRNVSFRFIPLLYLLWYVTRLAWTQ